MSVNGLLRELEPARPPEVVALPGFTLHFGVHPADSALPRHTHDQPTICYVVRGRFTEYSGGSAVDCESGTLKLMPAGEPHSNRFAHTATCGIRIDVDAARFADAPGISRALDERLHASGGRGSDLARRLLVEAFSPDDAARLTAEGLVLEMLAELTRGKQPRVSRRVPTWARMADDLLSDSFPASPTLGELARHVGVRPATLARGYRAAFGRTIGEQIRKLRVDAAERALRGTDLSLAEIALQAGFCDQSHFTNVFRRLRGVTPAVYRRMAR